MELVKGVPITKYCDDHRLTPQQRLELFIPVCQAIQHAHQKGIIHRDIKPSNILVAQYDGKPVPKVIDFGVAKAMGQQLTEQTLVTGFGNVIGTLEYMSPEQAELNQLDIDTRSDIYSLGVLLYELLTGSTPLDKKHLKEAAFMELLRVIREEEPQKPSTRLSNSTDSLPSVSAQRHMEPAKLMKLVRGELDWIVMKALEKDRSRRYETANGFAMDVQRYLNDEPVLACPPSAAYRLRKFARRHKAGLAAAGLILFFMALAAGGIGWVVRDRGARRGDAARRAEHALTGADAFENQENWPEGLRAVEQAEGFLAGFPEETAVRRRAQELRRDLEMGARLQEARLRQTDDVKEEHWDWAAADVAYTEAFQAYGLDVDRLDPQTVAGRIAARPIHRQLAAALDDWAVVRLQRQAEGWRQRLAAARAADPDEWRNRLRDALEAKDARALGKAVEDAVAAKQADDWPEETLVLLGDLGQETDWGGQVAVLLKRAQQRRPGDFWINEALGQSLVGSGSAHLAERVRFCAIGAALRPQSPGARLVLGNALTANGQLEEAIAEYREALRLKSDFETAHNNLGITLHDQGKFDEAIAEFREALRLKPDDAKAHHNLSLDLKAKGRLDDAIAELREELRLEPDYADAHSDLGEALRDVGRLDEAIAECQEAVRLRKGLPKAHNYLGLALRDAGRLDEAIAEHREAIRLKPEYPEAHDGLSTALLKAGRLDEAIAEHREAIRLKPHFPLAHYNFGRALYFQGKLDEAVAEYREALRLKPDYAEAHNNLGIALEDQGKLDDAIAEEREAVRLKPDYPECHDNLGNSLLKAGRLDEAIAEHREAIRLKPNSPKAHNNLGNALCDQGKLDDAIAECREAIRLKPDYAMARVNLGRALYAQGKRDEAVAEYRKAIELDPKYAPAHCNLGAALQDQKKLDEAIAEYREALRLKPDYAQAHHNLSIALCDRGKLDEAIAEAREAIRLKPDYAEAYNNLGRALYAQRKRDKAMAEYREALRLKPDCAEAHNNLGTALWDAGRRDEALAEYREAIRLKPEDACAHYNLASSLYDLGELDEAIAEYREALRLKPDDADAHRNLGTALCVQGKLDEAIAEYREALRLKPDYAEAHYNLGCTLDKKGDPDGAVAEYRKAIGSNPNYAEAHCNLGLVLQRRSEFRPALEELRRGHELGSKRPGWPYPSAQWVRHAERLVELDGKFPSILKGEAKPASTGECLELALMCVQYKKFNRAAAQLFAQAFAEQPQLADDLKAQHRYNAACAAALAGCGQGKDADQLDGNEKARLRGQALIWLRANLEAMGRLLDKEANQAPTAAGVAATLKHWQADPDLAGVRGPEALAQLPEAERQAWKKLWDDAADVLSRAQAKAMPEKKPDAK
jgi:tetratricopeptide (TPR) repeat protein